MRISHRAMPSCHAMPIIGELRTTDGGNILITAGHDQDDVGTELRTTRASARLKAPGSRVKSQGSQMLPNSQSKKNSEPSPRARVRAIGSSSAFQRCTSSISGHGTLRVSKQTANDSPDQLAAVKIGHSLSISTSTSMRHSRVQTVQSAYPGAVDEGEPPRPDKSPGRQIR
ncbi:hypothetical protein K402DRAFT_273388 [Aulographum hederae CBS 113979]|uniref:Uncharacterized protein n=1 Tax=Aulographum hederae CBS 113979 TaxID=1176131 RepID=A0A6G1H8F2_9PEZI|nr:hypothetical protein K402DRAFT_273388 [Aulographum hederae CBS 113979]